MGVKFCLLLDLSGYSNEEQAREHLCNCVTSAYRYTTLRMIIAAKGAHLLSGLLEQDEGLRPACESG